jgi:hypothetical protein
VSNGVPAAGAGNLETKASRDEYRFAVTEGGSVYLDVQSCPGSSYYLDWVLVNEATGASVKTGGCHDDQFTNLAAGTYRLMMAPSLEKTGAYSFLIFPVDPPQTFDLGGLTAPMTISNGTPAAGAGNLETKASRDNYKFTVTAGQSVYVDIQSCPSSYYLAWALVNDTTGATVDSGGCSDRQINSLVAGTYRIVFSVAYERIGAYSARLYDPALSH